MLASLKMGSKEDVNQHSSLWTNPNTDPLDVQAGGWLQERLRVPAEACSPCPCPQRQHAGVLVTQAERDRSRRLCRVYRLQPDAVERGLLAFSSSSFLPFSSNHSSASPGLLDCICSLTCPGCQTRCLTCIRHLRKMCWISCLPTLRIHPESLPVRRSRPRQQSHGRF